MLMFIGVTCYAQIDTDTLSVTLSAREVNYLWSSSGKLPAEEIEVTRRTIARELNGKLPEQGKVTLRLSTVDVSSLAKAVGMFPIQEALPLWVKLISYLDPKWAEVQAKIFSNGSND